MNQKFDSTLVKNRAEKIVNRHGITQFPVSPQMIAEKEGITVLAKNDCKEGVSGVLLYNGNQFGIMYSTFYHNTGFENFSIGHELGHYFLDGHSDKLLGVTGIHESHAGFTSEDQFERDADIFAASLLMPEDLFKDQLWKFGKGLDGIIAIANLCQTSLTATAIRYAELSDDFIIIVLSTNNKINYCCLSKKAWQIKNKEIPKKGWPIPKNTATELLSKERQRLLQSKRDSTQTDLADWINCDRSKTAIEEVIGLGNYGKVLTVISL
jgi:Zn-dependent peptidase ImmA (M78 family)